MMYGKVFDTLWTGSMRGRGDLQLIFIYLISNANSDGICDFLPQCVADATGKSLDVVKACLDELEQPDPLSRTREENGKRIKRLDPDRPWGWQIVNFGFYRDLANKAALRQAEAARKRKQRKETGKQRPGHVPDNHVVGVVDESEDREGESEGKQAETTKSPAPFDRFWAAYPRKIGKKAAKTAWARAKDKPQTEAILRALAEQGASEQWQKEGGRFVPHPATWLNQGRWADEVSVRQERKVKDLASTPLKP